MNQAELDTEYLRQWIGKKETVEETISAEPLRRMRATLDFDPEEIREGDEIPPLWHWAYFMTPVRASELGRDGHAALGEFMPPVPLPRRMWAGSQFSFKRAIRVGETARRESTVKDVKVKQGRTGWLCFVEVENQFYVDEELRFSEINNLVYRDVAQSGEEKVEPPKAPEDAQWTREVVPNSTLLFRYSALTFNGHRIHYDLDFCRDEEDYPGLVFHGPLTGTLLLQLAIEHSSGKTPKAYECRAYSPLFDNASFSLNGRMDGLNAEVWASNADGRLAMKATARFGR